MEHYLVKVQFVRDYREKITALGAQLGVRFVDDKLQVEVRSTDELTATVKDQIKLLLPSEYECGGEIFPIAEVSFEIDVIAF